MLQKVQMLLFQVQMLQEMRQEVMWKMFAQAQQRRQKWRGRWFEMSELLSSLQENV